MITRTNLFPLILVAAFLACIPMLMHAQVTQEWVQTYSAVNANIADIAFDNAGNIYAAGHHHDGSNDRALLLKYDPAGNLLWSQTFLGANLTSANAYALAVDGNGDVIITGSICCTSTQGFTAKYDANGQFLWAQTTTRRGTSISTDASNNVYVMTSEDGYWTGEIVKYNSSGVQQWSINSPYGVKIVVKDGSVYITGNTWIHLPGTPPASKTRVVSTGKYNTSNGTQVWTANYSHSDKKSQFGVDLVVDGSGNVYVAGTVFNKAGGSFYTTNWVTLKYSSSGVQQWVKFYDGNATDKSDGMGGGTPTDYADAIALDNSGNVIVTGTSYTTTGQFTSLDMTTVKYNPSGTQLWAKTFDGPDHKSDGANDITTTTSGNIYITGITAWTANSNSNATTVKYNSSGSLLWSVSYDSGIGDGAWALDLDNSGNVFVAGYANGSGATLLIKYSQTGTPKYSRDEQDVIPTAMSLSQNYPNPFNPSTTIRYSLVEESPVVLKVFNSLGMEVATLVNETKSAGTHSVAFNAENLVSGVYTYTLTVAGQTLSRKMVLVK